MVALKKLIIDRKKPSNSANNSFFGVEIKEQILICALRTMETLTTTEGVTKKLNKPVERGLTGRGARHPLHGAIIILLD
jgi:hypothetical protein